MNPVTVNLDHTLVSVSSSSMKSSAETNNGTKKDEAESRMLIPMSKLSSEAAALVLAGCHSLILIDGETTSKSGNVVPSPATEKKQAGMPIALLSEIKILTRHHFSSKLQRMSCVVMDVANHKY